MYSEGARRRCGTSSRSRFQFLSSRQPSARQPGEAGFDHHDLELGIALEHAFHDQARDLRLAAGGVLGHVLDVERRPAGIARRPAAGAEDVHADRQPGLDRRLVDRPIALLAHELAGAAAQQHMGEAAIARARLDFGARRFAVLVRNDDRRQEPRIAPVPAFELELVGGKRHGGAEFIVLVALPGRRERIHDRVFDPVEVEMLLAHEIEIAGRQPAAGRPGIAARGQRLALGIGKALGEALPLPRARRSADDPTSAC